jgi:hypothetical protein
MSSAAHQVEIEATRTEGRHARLRRRIANLVGDWGIGTFLTLPSGQTVLVWADGIYQAVGGSGAHCRSDDPHVS